MKGSREEGMEGSEGGRKRGARGGREGGIILDGLAFHLIRKQAPHTSIHWIQARVLLCFEVKDH